MLQMLLIEYNASNSLQNYFTEEYALCYANVWSINTPCKIVGSKCSSHISYCFTATNRLNQGGVFSPILFIVYMDCLQQELKASNVGCHISHVFIGAFAYADDIILLAQQDQHGETTKHWQALF